MTSLKSLAAMLVTCCAVLLPAAPAHGTTHRVMIQNYAYSPATLTIASGDTVTWMNMDSVQHDVSVTGGPATFQSPMLAQGKSWSYTFTTAGRYSYICSIHPDMKASVVVRPAPVTPQATAPAAAPTAAGPKATTKAVTKHTATAATTSSSAPKASAHPSHAATPTAQAAAATSATTIRPAEATLSPLLIVLGISAAVMVFCLLLIASRPQLVVPVGEPEEPEDD